MNNNQMSHDRYHHNTAQLQAQLQQHLSGGFMSNGIMSGPGMGGCGNNGMLSELPEPPVSFFENVYEEEKCSNSKWFVRYQYLTLVQFRHHRCSQLRVLRWSLADPMGPVCMATKITIMMVSSFKMHAYQCFLADSEESFS